MFQGLKSANKLARAKNVLKPVTGARMLSNNRFAFAPAITASRLSATQRFQPSAAVCARAMSTTDSKSAQTMEFQAETRKLLDIVTHSIYTDREVFIRELVSNASDALEKYRYKQISGDVTGTESIPLEINIYTDSKRKTLTIVDNGIGMSRDELIANLGTIARSGSKAFVENLKGGETPADSKTTTDGIIGQFGVGFYSSFMVSTDVEVASLSASDPTSTAHKWSSDGTGVFTIDTVPAEEVSEHLAQNRGSRITMKLKPTCEDYADPEKIKR